LLLNALQIANEKNSEKLILLAIEDITERRLIEQKLQTFSDDLEAQVIERTAALKKSNEDLRQTNVQLDQFAHVASHDLQEPLRKISMFSKRLQTIDKGELSLDVQTYINKIEGASGRMSLLIQDLLNYSRLLQHEQVYKTLNLNETIRNILNDFELLLQDKKAVVNCEILPTIDAIPLQMNQLFYNLFSNALKFSRENVAAIITITSRILSEEEVEHYPDLNAKIPYLEILFNDNGIGFNQQYAKQIFTIFQRLHGQETYSGTGIGLALCKKIVENHHGEICAFSKESGGATFQILLPVKQTPK
jgi:two-component system CheB/CheR fusion protein